uniref:Inter-alpha-trypsin inhibitor heavy chain family member 6 n=1 Tax=Hucho hucho TaxID=62062 RepID=A0A4W5QPQ2_9TELE
MYMFLADGLVCLVCSQLKVTDYHVRCSVVSRYAHTTIQSSVWNQLPVTKEAAFEVDLITHFKSSLLYYPLSLSLSPLREMEKFRVAVSVPSGTRMSFSLSYEELLPRRLGRYELTLGLRPGGLVTNLTLDVSIAERTGLSFIKVLPLKTSRLLSNTVTGNIGKDSHQCSFASSKGLNYLVRQSFALSQVFDGYFVHYFAPRGLPVVPKDVIFVIDVSGSMIGTKIKQTKQAMSTILGDLREGDYFNIITFSDKVHTWKKGRTVRATRSNIRDAKDFVKRVIAEGWTNINAALLSAAQLVNPPSSSSDTRRVPLVIFLTDGEATIGVTSGDFILSNAKSALGATSLFGLAFGDDADFPLLRRLALDNRGVARMVYEDADAALQLKGFYDEVASPLLSDIQLTYMDDQAFDVTRSLFPNYFQGSELVVTGKVKPGIMLLDLCLSIVFVSNGEGNRTVFSMGCPGGMDGIPSFVRRLWAYFTIKELLLVKLNTTDPHIQKLLGEKATNLSLQYNFVTPVTSLVVVKPDADEIPTSASTTTVRPTTTTATTTTTVAHTPATNIASPNPVKKPRTIKAKPDPLVTKPPPLQPPQPRKGSTQPTKPNPAKTVAPPSLKKTTTTTTPSPSAVKTVPVPLSGKTPTLPPSSPKTAPTPPARIVSTPLPNLLKTAAAPAPGKTTTTTPPPTTVKTIPTTTTSTTQCNTVKTTVPTTVKTTTSTTTTTSVRDDPTPAPQPRKPTTPLPISVRTVLPPVRISLSSSSSSDNATMSAADANQPQVTTHLYSLKYVPPTPAPQGSDTDTDPDVDQIATFVSATFAPMPGVTDGPKLWEAAGLLGRSSTNLGNPKLKSCVIVPDLRK